MTLAIEICNDLIKQILRDDGYKVFQCEKWEWWNDSIGGARGFETEQEAWQDAYEDFIGV